MSGWGYGTTRLGGYLVCGAGGNMDLIQRELGQEVGHWGLGSKGQLVAATLKGRMNGEGNSVCIDGRAKKKVS